MPWWVVPSLAYLIVFVFAAALAASCVVGNDTLRTQMFSTAVTLAVAATSFYFGSSAGSEKKDTTIASSSAALATSSPTQPLATQTAPQTTPQDTADAAAAAEALRLKTAAP